MSDPAKREIQISRSLAYLLRHGAVKEKLPIDSNGYIPVDVLLRHNRLKSLKCTKADIDKVVATNSKKRFHLKEEGANTLICATQGHSIAAIAPAEEVLEQIKSPDKLPAKLAHGTNLGNCKLILQSGFIKRMNRNHVHLSPGVTGVDSAVVSGMRTSSTVIIYLKLDKALDELRIYKSLNNVYLTPDDIPLNLVEKVTIRSGQKKNPNIDELLALLSTNEIPFSFY